MAEQQREVIKRISREHLLKNNGVLMGQCLSAVGWVGKTVPEMTEEEGIIELPMADVAGGYIVVGTALAGRRPLYIVRYQGFQWFNAPGIINYAVKAKELWGYSCPVFIRSIAMEGGIGPVASNSHHGLYYRMPGIPIAAPATSREYEAVWKYFMEHDGPLYVSEHRKLWDVDFEMPDIIKDKADITLLPISSPRLNALEARTMLENQGIVCNIIHLPWIKPFSLNQKDDEIDYSLQNSKHGGIVLDGDYPNGVAKNIAYDLMHMHYKDDKRKVYAMALEERTAGFAPHLDNLPPSPKQIYEKVREIIS